MKTINLETEVIRENSKILAVENETLAAQLKLDNEVAKVLQKADASYKQELWGELGFDYKLAEAARISKEREDFSHLPQNRIMGIGAIKAVCLKHGLRFLPTRYYKGALDEGIGAKLEEFKGLNGGKLPIIGVYEMASGGGAIGEGRPQFYIAAPSESFVLQPMPRDPLLFCRLNSIKFFLLHKWGTDLEDNGRKHDITEGNWNSIFSNTASGLASTLITIGNSANAFRTYVTGNLGTSTSGQYYVSTGTSNAANWTTTQNAMVFGSA